MSLISMIQQLAFGALTSVFIFVVTLVGSLPLGAGICWVRMRSSKLCSLSAQLYISVMRGTPLMLQLLVIYFAPFYVFGVQVSASYRLISVLLAFVLNYAAYFAEIYRSGLMSIPQGQYEAAQMLGFTRWQCLRKIIMPQLARIVLPAITNEVITLVKDTSLAFVVSVSEMFTVAKGIVAAQRSMSAFVAAGVFYYLFNAVIAAIMSLLERRFDYLRSSCNENEVK